MLRQSRRKLLPRAAALSNFTWRARPSALADSPAPPVRYVLFDLLYDAGRSLLHEPLARRRDVLATQCQRLEAADVQFSQGVVGQGRALYGAALAQGHEGVVAKHLASTYRPGRRSPAWRKIKHRPHGTCKARDIFSY
jgi:ATP-dependent DNA ligase